MTFMTFWTVGIPRCDADDRIGPLSDATPAIGSDHASESASGAEVLSQGSYAARQRATLDLWRSRDVTRDEVQQATRDPDPEVAQRARWILRQWQRGALPNNTPDIGSLLRQDAEPGDVEDLLEAGEFSAAVVAVEEVAGTLQRESVHQNISLALQRRFPIYVKLALDHDALMELLRLVDLVADNHQLAVCRIQLMQYLEQTIDDHSLLPSSSIHWSLAQRREANVLILAVLGRWDKALREAEQSNNEKLVRVCRMIHSDWHGIAADSVKNAKAAADGSLEQTRYWCLAMMAADRAGEQAIYDEAVATLSSDQASLGLVGENLSWQCLASHGEVNAGLRILNSINPNFAAQVAMASSHAKEAFEILGYPINDIDQNLGRWIHEAIQSQLALDEAQRDAGKLSVEASSLLMLMRCLIMVGHDDQAWRIATSLSYSNAKVGTFAMRDSVLSSLATTPDHDDWVVKLAVLPGERVISANAEASVIETLGSTSATTWKIMMDAIASMMPDRAFDERLQIVHQLFQGELPGGFDSNRDFKRLYERLSSGNAQRMSGRMILQNQSQVNQEIAELFSTHGQVEIAEQCLRQLLQRGDLNAALQIAQRQLDGGGLDASRQYLDFIWKQAAAMGQLRRDLRGRTGEIQVATKTLVGQWMIARRQGDEQRTEELTGQLRLTLCAPSIELRHALAGALVDQDENLLSEEAYRVLLLMTAMDNDEQAELVYIASDYAMAFHDHNPVNAAKWYDLAFCETLESTAFLPIGYITLPLSARRFLVEAAIASKDNQSAARHVQRLLKINPLDIDFAERLLPKLREAGMQELADTAFDQIFEAGKLYMQDFPFDATMSNNLAWVAAMNRLRLDEALVLVRQAVDREPDSAIYRDTLAEVLFQLGRMQEALQIEEACVLDDPGQWHLYQQIEKYQDAVKQLK